MATSLDHRLRPPNWRPVQVALAPGGHLALLADDPLGCEQYVIGVAALRPPWCGRSTLLNLTDRSVVGAPEAVPPPAGAPGGLRSYARVTQTMDVTLATHRPTPRVSAEA